MSLTWHLDFTRWRLTDYRRQQCRDSTRIYTGWTYCPYKLITIRSEGDLGQLDSIVRKASNFLLASAHPQGGEIR
jgi:hypothetical protein